jgi:hypothetical protein
MGLVSPAPKVTLESLGAEARIAASTVNVTSGEAIIPADRNALVTLFAPSPITANITLPYVGVKEGDRITLTSSFNSPGTVLTIRRAGQMAGTTPLSYGTLATIDVNGLSLTFVATNSFGTGWSLLNPSPLSKDNVVQEYEIQNLVTGDGVLGSGIQLTRNSSIPQAPGTGTGAVVEAKELVYRRVNGNSERLDAYLNTKLEWLPVPPLTATSPGKTGQMAYDGNYFYLCVGVNTWRRRPMAIW